MIESKNPAVGINNQCGMISSIERRLRAVLRGVVLQYDERQAKPLVPHVLHVNCCCAQLLFAGADHAGIRYSTRS